LGRPTDTPRAGRAPVIGNQEQDQEKEQEEEDSLLTASHTSRKLLTCADAALVSEAPAYD
jgi:hypothetical protein